MSKPDKSDLLEESASHPPCASVQLAMQSLGELAKRFDQHCEKQNANLERIWVAIDKVDEKLTKRPPWVVVVIITTLTTFLGIAVTVIGFLTR